MKWINKQVGKAMIKADNAREKRELKKEQGKEAQRKREERHKKDKK